MTDSEFSRSVYTDFANEQLNATRTAVAMCQASSRGDVGRWLQLLTVVPPAALITALSKVATVAIQALAEELETTADDVYKELTMKLAMSSPDEM